MDDILVFWKNGGVIYLALIKGNNLLKESNLIINTEKSIYIQREINFIAYHLKNNEIKAETNMVQTTIDFLKPRNNKEIQRFLGLVNYYRKFILKCAKRSELI